MGAVGRSLSLEELWAGDGGSSGDWSCGRCSARNPAERQGDSPIFVETKIGTVPKIKAGPIIAWTIMGLAFFFLLRPKSYGHEYYELMMLPAGAGWARWGCAICWIAATASKGQSHFR